MQSASADKRVRTRKRWLNPQRVITFIVTLSLIASASLTLSQAQKSSALEVKLTEGTNIALALSPDSKTIVFDLQGTLWTMPATGGKAKAITDELGDARQPAFSPDGKYLTCPNWRPRTANDADKHNAELAIISTETKSVFQYIPIARISQNFRFSPDSKAIEFIAALESGTQLMRQSFGESEPKPILTLPNDRIFNFAWSKDGKKIALSRGQQYRDAVLLTEFDK